MGCLQTGLSFFSVSMACFSMFLCASPNLVKASLALGSGSLTPMPQNTSPNAAKTALRVCSFARLIQGTLADESFINNRLYWREKSVWSHGERSPMENWDNSKIQEDPSDIRAVLKQLPDVTTVIMMALCEIFCLETKQFEANIEWISCFSLESMQSKVRRFSFVITRWIVAEGFYRQTSVYKPRNWKYFCWVHVLWFGVIFPWKINTDVGQFPFQLCLNRFSGGRSRIQTRIVYPLVMIV